MTYHDHYEMFFTFLLYVYLGKLDVVSQNYLRADVIIFAQKFVIIAFYMLK